LKYASREIRGNARKRGEIESGKGSENERRNFCDKVRNFYLIVAGEGGESKHEHESTNGIAGNREKKGKRKDEK